MTNQLSAVRGWIDLDLLEAERKGHTTPPTERKATEAARNEAAANRWMRNGAVNPEPPDYPTVVPSVEEHLLSKGYTKGAVSEALLDLAKHQDEPKPVPDLTYFSEWENAVGLHYPDPPPVAGDAQSILTEIFNELDLYNAELGSAYGFAHVDLAEFEKRQQAKAEAFKSIPAAPRGPDLLTSPFEVGALVRHKHEKTRGIGKVTREARYSRDGRGLIQAVDWGGGDEFWGLTSDIELATPAPITDESIQSAIAEYQAAFPAHQIWHAELRAPPKDPFLAHHVPDCACSSCEARRA